MEEDIKTLKKFIHKPVRQEEFNKISNKEIQAVEHMLNRLEQLEEENENLKRLHINIQGMRSGKELLNKYINDSIPKSVIREELRTLKNMLPTALHETSRAVFNGEIALLERILGEE